MIEGNAKFWLEVSENENIIVTYLYSGTLWILLENSLASAA